MTVFDRRPLDESDDNFRSVGRDEFLTRQIGLLASGNPQGCRKCCGDKASDCCQPDTVSIHKATAASYISSDDGADTEVTFFGGLISFIAASSLMHFWKNGDDVLFSSERKK